MSLGITISIHKKELYNVCQKLKDKGVILVAAFDNMEVVSYPAAFDNVIGVASSNDCSKITDIEFFESSTVNICGKGGLQRVNWVSPKYIFTQGNSYACAHVTGILSKTTCHNLEEGLAYLRSIAIKKYTQRNDIMALHCPKFQKGCKAVLFPFNKEMHSLIRFKNLLCVELTDVYDVRQSARVNASVNKLLGLNLSADYIIKNIENIDWNSFDIFILGHMNELSRLTGNIKWRETLILDAYNHGKYIYCFDDISDIVDQFSLSLEQVYYPKTTVENINFIPLGMLYRPWFLCLGFMEQLQSKGNTPYNLYCVKNF